ncbi:MAG: hypothetical protein QXP03_02960 [Desulfurococcaceae archaeon]
MTVIEVKCTEIYRDDRYLLGNFEKIIVTCDMVVIYFSNDKRIELLLSKNDYVVVRNPKTYCTEIDEEDEEE